VDVDYPIIFIQQIQALFYTERGVTPLPPQISMKILSGFSANVNENKKFSFTFFQKRSDPPLPAGGGVAG
jgi:hypothetical protein